ncbi:MAG: 30S ribosomal protein S5 [Patescibacteria group bacterium]|jgi:small subunit ribosomal protein S5
MTEEAEKDIPKDDVAAPVVAPVVVSAASDVRAPARGGARRGGGRDAAGGNRRPRRDTGDRDQEFDQKIIDLARVTRVMAGGKRMRFRACVAIGDHKGRVGVGLGKGADVSLAIAKAAANAKKDLIEIPLYEDTLPHEIYIKYGAAKILLKPAPRGTGIIAGGAVRSVLELGGVPNVAAKMLGSRSKLNNARATILALRQLKVRPPAKKKAI